MFMEWLLTYGLWSVALLMLLQNLIPLLPSEVIMPLAGFLASLGYLDLRGAILAGLLGSLTGHLPWYALGRVAGEQRLQDGAARYGRWFGIGPTQALRANLWFRRNAVWAVLAGRLIPGIRTCVNIPAGAARMPFFLFLGYTALGEAIWTAALAWGGYSLGREYHLLSWYLHVLAVPVLLIAAAILLWALLRKRTSVSGTGPGAEAGRNGVGKAAFRGFRFRRPGFRGLRHPGIPKGA